ncbi:MAG: TetR/AcrR family transcriptional regulator [Anaerolineae bacterium]|nr:TetR/AcrR family transcriptional regulator [Anaerolineae bacterium]
MARSRHEQRKAATHQGLIDAARDVIAEKGYNYVDILDITERANVSKATFYKHFANKEACVRELMEQGFDALVIEVLSVDRPDTISPEWIQQSFTKVFGWAEANRDFLLIMVGGAASTQLNAFGRNYMAEVVERTIASDFIPADTPARFPPIVQAQIITGIVIQLLGWWLEAETDYSASEMGRIVQEALLLGIGTLIS